MGRGHSHGAESNLRLAFFLNLFFTVLEIVGGIWTNSVAILADAIHDAGDVLSLGVAWYLQRTAAREPTQKFTYGFHRFSVLGALFAAVVLIIGMTLVVWNAVPRLFHPEEVHAPGMIALAFVGIGVNALAYYRTHRGASLSEQVVSWHLLEDVLGWLAVLIGSLLMTFWDVPIVDPLLSLGIAAFVAFNVFRQLWRIGLVFLQSVPEGFDLEAFKQAVGEIPKVQSSHHDHLWTLDGEQHVLTIHLVMDPSSTRGEIVDAKQQVLKLIGGDSIVHATIAVELAGEGCDGEIPRNPGGHAHQ